MRKPFVLVLPIADSAPILKYCCAIYLPTSKPNQELLGSYQKEEQFLGEKLTRHWGEANDLHSYRFKIHSEEFETKSEALSFGVKALKGMFSSPLISNEDMIEVDI